MIVFQTIIFLKFLYEPTNCYGHTKPKKSQENRMLVTEIPLTSAGCSGRCCCHCCFLVSWL